MKIIETGVLDLKLIIPQVFGDSRGYFIESYNKKVLKEFGVESDFIQDNESMSKYGVMRGLHYQLPPYSQTKLVRVIAGSVFDVALDLRKKSPTYGKWFGVELSGENKKQLFIPRGFAHGFCVTSEYAIFAYKCDNIYNPGSERAIHCFDKELNIDWQVDIEKAIMSDKDKIAASFLNAENPF